MMAQQSQINGQTLYIPVAQENVDDGPFTNAPQTEGQGQQTRQPTRTLPKPLNNMSRILLGTFGSTLCLVILCLLLAIPILQIVIGTIYRDVCPINPKIPIYLIVSGASTIACIVVLLLVVRYDFVKSFKQFMSSLLFCRLCLRFVWLEEGLMLNLSWADVVLSL